MTYVDMAAVRRLGEADAKRFTTVGRPANRLLDSYTPGPWGEHLELSQIDTTVDAEDTGRWVGSFDAAAITASLKSHGYTSGQEDGRQVWKHPGGTRPSLEVSDHEIAYSFGDTEPMTDVHPKKGASLADRAEYQRLADCLGDVYRADIAPLTAAKPVRLSALGQQADSAARNTEVLCALVEDEATADRLLDSLRSVVREKAPRYDGTEVTVQKGDRPVVRVTVPDTAAQQPGRLFLSDIDLGLAVAGL
ncbi:hypothetical protein JS756_31730 [Streptomyces actuosus]|uniref:Uncharacterized protein n=1 Tax=Streptomyces actuosus TaxID=1885 RepID=A0ABS2VZL6_STRAS|nr:hypothetical protein [Streptomyces actuosus]